MDKIVFSFIAVIAIIAIVTCIKIWEKFPIDDEEDNF